MEPVFTSSHSWTGQPRTTAEVSCAGKVVRTAAVPVSLLVSIRHAKKMVVSPVVAVDAKDGDAVPKESLAVSSVLRT